MHMSSLIIGREVKEEGSREMKRKGKEEELRVKGAKA